VGWYCHGSTREFRERPDDRSGAPPGHLSRRRAGWSRRHGNRKHTVHGTHGYRLGKLPGEEDGMPYSPGYARNMASACAIT
jgi:hypothetical protein